jgi:DNA-directed RNA polymerase subunit M/transcription elongation factor TFIIS
MFCPRCSDKLIRYHGELYCQRGEMGLSQMIEQLLQVALDSSPQQSRDPSYIENFKVTEWFCPRCQHHLHSENPHSLQLHCSECGLVVLVALFMTWWSFIHTNKWPLRRTQIR